MDSHSRLSLIPHLRAHETLRYLVCRLLLEKPQRDLWPRYRHQAGSWHLLQSTFRVCPSHCREGFVRNQLHSCQKWLDCSIYRSSCVVNSGLMENMVPLLLNGVLLVLGLLLLREFRIAMQSIRALRWRITQGTLAAEDPSPEPSDGELKAPAQTLRSLRYSYTVEGLSLIHI